jgi:hypothetical protein
MGFLGDLGNVVTGGLFDKPSSSDATSSAYGTQQVTTMARPSEFDTMFNEFMNQYLGVDPNLQNEINAIQRKIDQNKAILPARYAKSSNKGHNVERVIDDLEKQKLALQSKMNETAGPGFQEMLGVAYGDKDTANKQYVDAVSKAMQPHSGILGDIVNKQMAGEAVGPYGADIDKLLGERIGISFGGGNPMQFITGSQQRLLSDLLKSQESGLGQIKDTSMEKALADLMPAQKTFDLFQPSNVADLAYMQDLRSFIEPMEYARMSATPSVTGSASQTMSPLQAQQMNTGTWGAKMGNLSSLMDLFSKGAGMF